MSFQIVCGRSGSGKSSYIIDRIKNLAKDEKAIVLVPDQFSFAAEKRLLTNLGGIGLNGREVLTFSRFVHRMVLSDKEYIKPAGKQMLLCKAVENIKKENSIFEKSLSKPGFIDVLANLISEMKRYRVDTDMLREKTDAMPDGMLRRKLDAILRIYVEYNNLLPENMTDSEDDLAQLALSIMQSNDFENTHIYIDEFSDFLPQHYKVIEALMYKAKTVTAALCTDGGNDDFSLFMPVQKTAYRLKCIADNASCPVLPDIILHEQKRFKNEELAFLEHEWGSDEIFDKSVENICCFEALDAYSEIEHTAIKIISLVRDEGYRFSDICVLCADLENYENLIEVIFKSYGISYFTDRKVPVTSHPIILPVLAIFEVFADSFSYASVFSYLRSGYAGVSDSEIDLLENYVLEHGIRGKKIWLGDEEWNIRSGGIFDEAIGEGKASPNSDNIIDDIRRRVIKPFIKFEQSFEGRKTIREICTALFEFLENGISLVDTIKSRINQFIEDGNMDEAEQYRQIWKILIDVMDQAVMVMGDDVCGMERFSEILTAALAQYEIGIIPSSVDMVSIGNVDRSRSSEMRALFVIGATYEKLPKISTREGILSDNDRNTLARQGIELAPDTRAQIFDGLFKIYKAVTNASEKLFVSYSGASTDGTKQTPAALITDLQKRFLNMTTETGDISQNGISPQMAVLPAPAFAHMITALTSQGACAPEWKRIYEWYEQHDEYKDRLHIIEDAKANRTSHLSKTAVDKLYPGEVEYSASRLERFADCPFKYFMMYGLGAKEREVWGVKSLDIGKLMHDILRRYCECVESSKESDTYAGIKAAWRSLTDEKSDEIIKALMQDAREIVLKNEVHAQGSVNFLLELLEKNLRESAKVLLKSVITGEFAPIAYEKDFSGFKITSVSGNEVLLKGQIDRIDIVEADDKAYIRIMDYKSGGKEMDLAKIFNSFDMQLIIYAQAAIELYKQGKLVSQNGKPVQIAGIFYSSLSDGYDKVTLPFDENSYSKKYQFKGLLLKNEESLKATDKGYDADFRSEMFPFAVTKGGAISGNSRNVIDEAAFDRLSEFVNKKISDADNQIRNGNIEVYPYSDEGCRYCPYDAVCRFDPSTHKCRPKKTYPRFGFWDAIEKELSGEEE